ncbi:MAG: NUDIX hydrolase [Myxococcota bacterium]
MLANQPPPPPASDDDRVRTLRGALSRFRDASPQAAAATRMLSLLETAGPRAFDRRFFAPGHFTASAFVLDVSTRRVLLIHHRKLGLWLQPGGHVDADDVDLEACARRELAEETHLLRATPVDAGTILDVDIHRIPARGDEPRHLHFDVRFAFVSTAAGDVRADSDAAAVRWFDEVELAAVGTDDSVRRSAARLVNATMAR